MPESATGAADDFADDGSAALDNPLLDALKTHNLATLASLKQLHEQTFTPDSRKILRRFTSKEAASLIGISEGHLRSLSLQDFGPQPDTSKGGHRLYSLEDISTLRENLARRPGTGDRYVKHRRGDEMLQIIAVANFKGGSGKTTTSVYLAQHLALQGYRVLAVDLDPQASLTAMLDNESNIIIEDYNVYDAIRYDEEIRPMKEIIRKTYFPGLDLAPAGMDLMEFETFSSIYGVPTASRAREAHKVVGGRVAEPWYFARIMDAIYTVEHNYDVVVIDCPPNLGYITFSALCAATGILVPFHPEMLDVLSMCSFLRVTHDYLEVLAKSGAALDCRWLRYVPTRYEAADNAQSSTLRHIRHLYGDWVLNKEMIKSTAISAAGLTKQTIYEIDKKSKVVAKETYDRAFLAINDVNDEIEKSIKMIWGR